MTSADDRRRGKAIIAMREVLDAYEAEIRGLREALHKQQSVDGVELVDGDRVVIFDIPERPVEIARARVVVAAKAAARRLAHKHRANVATD